MRTSIVVLGLMAALFAVPLTSSAATLVNMNDLHISIELPTGWTYERNASTGGVTYDLEIQGPTSGSFQPYGLMDHRSWPGSVSNSTLWAEMENELDDVREDPEVTSVVMISVAVNSTINGVTCNDMTIDLDYSGTTVRERLVVLASDDWNMGWKLGIACVSSQWSTYSSQIDTIINSLTVAEKPPSNSSALLLGVGIVLAVVIVIAVVLLVMRGRKKPEPGLPATPSVQPPMQPPPPPPSS